MAGTYAQIATFGLAGGKKNEGTLNLSIADAATGEVLWRRESNDVSSSDKTEKIIDYIMKSITKSFPYHNNLIE
ncbi:hypothetical protein SDC9_191783 [bioreactor metagenome]|uniref:DUF4136 domain-containing protein n=1 Tax=bioreactor metagenome TaxID=1076179 RepID=A0A645I0F0_9ZZZZ